MPQLQLLFKGFILTVFFKHIRSLLIENGARVCLVKYQIVIIEFYVILLISQHIDLCRVRQLIRNCDEYIQLKSAVLFRNSSGHLFDSCLENSSGM